VSTCGGSETPEPCALRAHDCISRAIRCTVPEPMLVSAAIRSIPTPSFNILRAFARSIRGWPSVLPFATTSNCRESTEDECFWAVKNLLFDYVKSPSPRHIRDPDSVTRLAAEIVKQIDRGNSDSGLDVVRVARMIGAVMVVTPIVSLSIFPPSPAIGCSRSNTAGGGVDYLSGGRIS
jgi:hypothetical protein